MTDEILARSLHSTGTLTREQLQTAIKSRGNGERLGQTLVRLGLMSQPDLVRFQTQHVNDEQPHSAEHHSNGHNGDTLAHAEEDINSLPIYIVDHDDSTDPAQAPVVRYANELLKYAISLGASDVHFEPQPKGLLPRYRVDGALQAGQLLPIELSPPILSRFKVLANLDITEQRLPQDGRFRVKIGTKVIDFRVSSLPSLHGEKIVLRLLNHSSLETDLGKLGFTRRDRLMFEKMLQRSHGMILVTGPTGSGKTTTLYAALSAARDATKNVMTIEDPVEYELEGITQTSINADIGLNFARVLRASLRQDPDVILVGEIRDEETADIAVRAALTGHLMLSTIHTNSAVATVSRLRDMGVPSYLLASSIAGILAQRLARLTCRSCRGPVEPNDPRRGEWAEFFNMPVDTPFQEGKGCDKCKGRGTRGRVAIVEVMDIDSSMRRAISADKDAESLREIAREDGFLTMMDDAREKIRAGFLSPEEGMKVLMGHEE
ncbi:putative type II secretion system protein E [Abditibacteriota bacterium]|nr:putative type II secretion system protein E [Abditibacteriota bacterium]